MTIWKNKTIKKILLKKVIKKLKITKVCLNGEEIVTITKKALHL